MFEISRDGSGTSRIGSKGFQVSRVGTGVTLNRHDPWKALYYFFELLWFGRGAWSSSKRRAPGTAWCTFTGHDRGHDRISWDA